MSEPAALQDAPDATQPPPKEPPPEYILDCAQVIVEHDADLRAMNPPCKLTSVVAVRLLMAIRDGAHYQTACALARISYETFVNWRNRADDEPDNRPFVALMQAVKLAEAEAEVESIRDVRSAAKIPRNWAAGMTFLERRHPDRWKRRDDNTLQVNVGVAIGVQASDDQRRQMVPTVIVQSAESLGKMAPVHGLNTPSPALGLSSGLSPASEMAVSGDRTEAKATPIEVVSPASVA